MTELAGYALRDLAGRGAMGEVWRAEDAHGNVVAVKVVRDGSGADALRDEVRAIAALRHPNVVHVLDLGRAPDGSPFVVMEWADRGALDLERVTDWSTLRRVLRALLDGLAHVHARDIVHCDVKPSNVLLLTGDPVSGPRVVLSDFGIAALHRDDPGPGRVMGTPAFMAPEQFLGRVQALGPATDLYALGVLGWAGITGRAPFQGDATTLRTAHQRQALPPFAPRFPVPAGVEAWLRQLLEKAPRGRFACAADASWALDGLGEPVGAAAPLGGPALPAGGTLTMVDAPLPGAAPVDVPHPVGAAPRRPFASWLEARRSEEVAASAVVAGSGLAHVRAHPTVGREALRSRLWDALDGVRGGGLRRVVLRGPSGFGKSHLAEWLVHRVRELGAAEVLVARHGRVPGPSDGLVGALERRLRLVGLDGSALEEHVADVLPDLSSRDRAALVRLIRPGPSPLADDERMVLLGRVLGQLAGERPLVLIADDAQWAPETLAWIDGLARDGLSAVVVLTWRTDAPEAAPLPEADVLDVGPLAPAEVGALVRAVLPLDDELCARLEARSGGNPSFAVALVQDWARRGAVKQGRSGYALEAGGDDLPARLRSVWLARVEDALDPLDPEARIALERAAALGAEVDGAEWAAATGDLAPRLLGEVRERLLDDGLAHATERGFAFVHPALPEAIEHAARASGRSAGHHERVARVVAGDAQRVGVHLFAAGAYDEAADALLTGAREASAQGRYQRQLQLLDLAERALEALGDAGGRSSRLAGLRSHALLQRGRLDDALTWGERALALATTPALRGEALRRQAAVLARRGAITEAIALQGEAAAALDAVEAGPLAWSELAGYHLRHGRLDEARNALARVGSRTGGSPHDRIALLLGRGQVARFDQRPLEALAQVEEALAIARAVDHRRWVGVCANMAGEILRDLGREGEAAAAYAESIAALEDAGSRDAVILRLNLAVLHARGERYADGLAVLEHALAELRRLQRAPLVAGAVAVRLWCLAGVGAFATWDADHAECVALLTQTGFCDPDIGRAAHAAARLCVTHAEPARARKAVELAVAQFRQLGRDADADAVLEELARA